MFTTNNVTFVWQQLVITQHLVLWVWLVPLDRYDQPALLESSYTSMDSAMSDGAGKAGPVTSAR